MLSSSKPELGVAVKLNVSPSVTDIEFAMSIVPPAEDDTETE
jgi:hypothetical protein